MTILYGMGGSGGGVQGVQTLPPFGPRCRPFNSRPKVGPPPFFLLVYRASPKMDPLLKNPGSAPRIGVSVKTILSST